MFYILGIINKFKLIIKLTKVLSILFRNVSLNVELKLVLIMN